MKTFLVVLSLLIFAILDGFAFLFSNNLSISHLINGSVVGRFYPIQNWLLLLLTSFVAMIVLLKLLVVIISG